MVTIFKNAFYLSLLDPIIIYQTGLKGALTVETNGRYICITTIGYKP